MKSGDLDTLREALPYINRFRGTTFVVKIGGEIADQAETLAPFCQEAALLARVGIRMVVIHGGGKQASELQQRLGIEPRMVQGRRVTDSDTLDIVMMAFAGKVNTEILSSFRKSGVDAVGLSGIDGGIVHAVRRPPKQVRDEKTGIDEMVDYGHVGDIERVDPRLLTALLDQDFVPVIASLGGDDDGAIFNINADTVAAKIAGALRAEKLILVTDVEGILDGGGALISRATPEEVDSAIRGGVIRGGMVPKAQSAVGALGEGVGTVHIISGKRPSTLLGEVFTEKGSGTMITRTALR